jgi:hypothetical protein
MAIKMAPIGQPEQTAAPYRLDIPQQRIGTPRNSVIVTRNSSDVTQSGEIADLKARIAKLEAIVFSSHAAKQSRAEYMREYRKRQRETK